MKKPKINALVIGVAGGSGSGKTTVVNLICDHFGQQNILRIEHDSYYRDLKHMPFEDRLQQNFDHPASLETDLLIRHLRALLEGYPVHVPQYNFAEHIRSEVHLEAQPTPVILISFRLSYYPYETVSDYCEFLCARDNCFRALCFG